MAASLLMEVESWRRMARERQGWCMACQALVEGVDKYRSPHDDTRGCLVACHHCGEEGIAGAMDLRDRRLIEVLVEPDREALEMQLFAGLPFSHEGRDKHLYVWVDGQFECLAVMKHALLKRLVARLGEMTAERMERLTAVVAERYPELAAENRMRGL